MAHIPPHMRNACKESAAVRCCDKMPSNARLTDRTKRCHCLHALRRVRGFTHVNAYTGANACCMSHEQTFLPYIQLTRRIWRAVAPVTLLTVSRCAVMRASGEVSVLIPRRLRKSTDQSAAPQLTLPLPAMVQQCGSSQLELVLFMPFFQ